MDFRHTMEVIIMGGILISGAAVGYVFVGLLAVKFVGVLIRTAGKVTVGAMVVWFVDTESDVPKSDSKS